MHSRAALLTIVALITGTAHAQGFKGHISGTFGILNPKIRVQYEKPLKDRASWGVNMNYYLVNWTGPVFEPFYRIYKKKDGNAEGTFFQAKLIYGNLSTLDFEDYNGAVLNKRWSTLGLGAGVGHKWVLGKGFTIESLSGFRFLSPPVYNYRNSSSEDDYADIAEGAAWYLTTGLPFDLQLKFGYQF